MKIVKEIFGIHGCVIDKFNNFKFMRGACLKIKKCVLIESLFGKHENLLNIMVVYLWLLTIKILQKNRFDVILKRRLLIRIGYRCHSTIT